ncbi:MAG: OmpA family protein [Schleiferiaceae bacterium]|nr:OmpA family protein [Schleiferiaceae bacterium]
MRKVLLIGASAMVLLSSCVSKKKFTALQEQHQETEAKLGAARMELAKFMDDAKKANKEVEYLKSVNYQLLNSVGELSTLSKKEAENLSKSLESLREKDMQIRSIQDAKNRQDSVTLALVTSLKGVLGNLNDEDISINVEKGVVYVSISDRLLFRSGSYEVSKEAEAVLGKVAKVANNRPDFEVLVEGHTDNKAISTAVLSDNWDLSVKRATSVVRVLEKFDVKPERMIASGRGEYVPVATNDSAQGRAANRRTKIILLPKLDEFYGLIEEGMKKL